jgi:hypothetical protein
MMQEIYLTLTNGAQRVCQSKQIKVHHVLILAVIYGFWSLRAFSSVLIQRLIYFLTNVGRKLTLQTVTKTHSYSFLMLIQVLVLIQRFN